MTTAVPTMYNEDGSWFARNARRQSRTSFDFSCFEDESLLLDYESIESMLFPATTVPTPSLDAGPGQPPVTAIAHEECKLVATPNQFGVTSSETRMWQTPPIQQQDPRGMPAAPYTEFQPTYHPRPMISQNLFTPPNNNAAPAQVAHHAGYPGDLHHSFEGNYERDLVSQQANRPVKIEKDSHYQINHQPTCPHYSSKMGQSNSQMQEDDLDVETKASQKAPQYTFMDITPYMTLPQAEAARQLGIPVSTLSKRWRVATGRRKWPWRVVSKLDKEITTLLYNINIGTGNSTPDKDKDLEERLGYLLAKREKALRSVRIRISNANKQQVSSS